MGLLGSSIFWTAWRGSRDSVENPLEEWLVEIIDVMGEQEVVEDGECKVVENKVPIRIPPATTIPH